MSLFAEGVHQRKNTFQTLFQGNRFDLSIVVNETKVYEFVEDMRQLQMQYETTRRQMAMEMVELIQDKYKQTLAKLYVEFGRTVAPLVQQYADLLKTMQPSSLCDSQCLAQKCVRPHEMTDACYKTC